MSSLSSEAIAMKMYLNETFTSLRLDSMEVWMKVSDRDCVRFKNIKLEDKVQYKSM